MRYGNIDVSALNDAIIHAEVSNKAETTVVVITGSTSLAIGIAIASNMVNSRSSAEIVFPAAYTSAAPPSLFTTGDRIVVGPGTVYEYTGASPRGPPADYATDPDFLLVTPQSPPAARSESTPRTPPRSSRPSR